MDMFEIGQTIADTRKRLKITQADLASRAGISRSRLSQLENGMVNDLGVRKIMAICAVIHLELSVQTIGQKNRPTLYDLLKEQKHGANHGTP